MSYGYNCFISSQTSVYKIVAPKDLVGSELVSCCECHRASSGRFISSRECGPSRTGPEVYWCYKNGDGMALLNGLLNPVGGSIDFTAQEVKVEKPKWSAISLAGHELLNQFLRPLQISHAFQHAGESSNGLRDHRSRRLSEVEGFFPLLLTRIGKG